MGTRIKPRFMTLPVGRSYRSLFANNLDRVLREEELSATQLAMETGLDPDLMTRIVSGAMRPSKYVLHRLAESALGVPYKTLVAWCLLDDCLEYSAKEAIVF